jgi:hypothetical protein
MQPDNPHLDYHTPEPPPTSRALLITAWLVVSIPAAWGVSQTVMRSMDLFTSPTPAPSTQTIAR